jgi:hypothetical protein
LIEEKEGRPVGIRREILEIKELYGSSIEANIKLIDKVM